MLPERIESKIDASGDCWLWTGARNSDGYGSVRSGNGGPMTSAHRFVYEALAGPIPEGLDIDHLCRVRRCVNPDHLEPVTRRENLRRGMTWKWRGGGVCRNGHDPSRVTSNSRGHLRCLDCKKDWMREYRAKRRQAVSA